MNSLRLNSYLPGHASVMGFFKEKFPNPLKPIVPYDVEYCSRTLLKRIEESVRFTFPLVLLAYSDIGSCFFFGF